MAKYKRVQVITSEPIPVADYVRMASTTPVIAIVSRLLQVLANRNLVNAKELAYIVTGKRNEYIKFK